jgi:hypothetical protein
MLALTPWLGMKETKVNMGVPILVSCRAAVAFMSLLILGSILALTTSYLIGNSAITPSDT